MSRMCFRRNPLSDRTFETYLSDINRLSDYKEVRDVVLPNLLHELDQQFEYRSYTFTCTNRFEGRDPALRIDCPLGFMPATVDIEFAYGKHAYCVKHEAQLVKINGEDDLSKNLRVILTMGWAHAQAL